MTTVAELFHPPGPAGQTTDDDGWSVESLEYKATPRPKSQFKTILDSNALFGASDEHTTVVTRHNAQTAEITVRHHIGEYIVREVLECGVNGGLKPQRLTRTIARDDGEPVRDETVQFGDGPLRFPGPTYPEVMLPFLMRWVPRDGRRRAAYAYTNDRFVARVYYERHKGVSLNTPYGQVEADEVWMYPDLNDWIAMGGLLTRLAKPLLPRYEVWFETTAPHRVLRFEGPYGPPGAPEVVLELAR